MNIELTRTPDILSEAMGKFIRVGFAAESEDVVKNAAEKLQRKGLDFIVANDITSKSCGFGADTNKVTIIDKEGTTENLPLMNKREVADKILDRIVAKIK
jgi:phosphopantothenoylcysteine decarboxylase/phosphopantothenate--cysteine ligase